MKMEHAEDAGPRDEASLVVAAQNDPAAFEPLYERYVDAVYRYVYHRVGNHAEAEVVTSQSFQEAIAALPAFEGRETDVEAWLLKIAEIVIAQRARATGREVAAEDLTTCSPAHALEGRGTIETDNTGHDLLVAMKQLPLEQQRAIVLRFSHGLSSREIGDAMDRSEEAARQLIYQALSSLQAVLEQTNDE